MRLSPTDYKSLIYSRCENIRRELYDQRQGLNIAGRAEYNNDVPDFGLIRGAVAEISDLVNEYERAVGPA